MLLLAGCAAGIIGTTAGNAETITYSYDALGRLRTSSVSGGPDAGTNTAICYDAAGNRERYTTTVAGAATCTPPTYLQPFPQRASGTTPPGSGK